MRTPHGLMWTPPEKRDVAIAGSGDRSWRNAEVLCAKDAEKGGREVIEEGKDSAPAGTMASLEKEKPGESKSERAPAEPEAQGSKEKMARGQQESRQRDAKGLESPSAQMTAQDRYSAIVAYLEAKIHDKDWHGVRDAAVDLELMEAKNPALKQI